MAESLVLKGRILPPQLAAEAFLAAASLGHPVGKVDKADGRQFESPDSHS